MFYFLIIYLPNNESRICLWRCKTFAIHFYKTKIVRIGDMPADVSFDWLNSFELPLTVICMFTWNITYLANSILIFFLTCYFDLKLRVQSISCTIWTSFDGFFALFIYTRYLQIFVNSVCWEKVRKNTWCVRFVLRLQKCYL